MGNSKAAKLSLVLKDINNEAQIMIFARVLLFLNLLALLGK